MISPELRYELIHIWGRLSGLRLVNVGLLPEALVTGEDYLWSDLQSWCMRVYDDLWDFLVRQQGSIKPTEILELGCGQGLGLTRLAHKAPDARLTGLDRSHVACLMARLAGVRARQGRSQAMPFAGQEFDAVLAVESLFIFPDTMAALTEVRRVLKTGGRLAVAEYVLSDLPSELDKIRAMGEAAGLRLVDAVDRTADARRSILLGEPQRDRFHRKVPFFFRAGFREALSIGGTERHASWADGRRSYYLAVFEAV